MTNFDRAFDELLGNEGGYVDNPDDPGGITNWGITERVARENGYQGDIQDLPKETAKEIYAKKYWLLAFDSFSYLVAFQIFDAAVNHGLKNAIRWAQKVENIPDDGKWGHITEMTLLVADPCLFIIKFNAIRLEFYTQLSTWGSFGKGWARRIVNNLRKV